MRGCVAFVALLLLTGCGSTAQQAVQSSGPAAASSTATAPVPSTGASTQKSMPAARPVPQFDHVVIVIEENHSSNEILGNPDAPFINSLATSGVSLTNMHAITHPSQPNYLAMFSGSTQGVTDDSCGQHFTGPNLAAQLIAAGQSFAGYSEDLPATGSDACSGGGYARKHNPWSDFANVPAADNKPFTAFASAFGSLPSLSYVVPNLDNDMHDGTVSQADQWLSAKLGDYARWAPSHNSLLIVTWDENDTSPGNQISTVLVGAHLRPGKDAQPATHYSVLRALEDSFGVAHLGGAMSAPALTGFWK